MLGDPHSGQFCQKWRREKPCLPRKPALANQCVSETNAPGTLEPAGASAAASTLPVTLVSPRGAALANHRAASAQSSGRSLMPARTVAQLRCPSGSFELAALQYSLAASAKF